MYQQGDDHHTYFQMYVLSASFLIILLYQSLIQNLHTNWVPSRQIAMLSSSYETTTSRLRYVIDNYLLQLKNFHHAFKQVIIYTQSKDL